MQEAIGSVHYISPEQAKGSKIRLPDGYLLARRRDVRNADGQAAV